MRNLYNKVSSVVLLLILLFVPFLIVNGLGIGETKPELLNHSATTTTQTKQEDQSWTSFFDINEGLVLRVLFILFIIAFLKYVIFKINKMKSKYERKK
jgi:magnesium-transporting ATPase (P-type)